MIFLHFLTFQVLGRLEIRESTPIQHVIASNYATFHF